MTPTTAAPQSKAPQSKEAPAKAVNPRDERVRKQRASDARVKRLGKIVTLAEVCRDPACQAIASFSMLGEGFVLSRDQTLEVATAMLKAELAAHVADPDADPLPNQLDWAIEMAEAHKPKSPSMTPQSETQEKQDPKESKTTPTGHPDKKNKK